ncbi:unnamed protein product, partial [Urochloa humidicola]
ADVQLSPCCCETSCQDEKCGVHAFVLVIIFLLDQFNLDGIWTPREGSVYHGILQLVVYCIYSTSKERPKTQNNMENGMEVAATCKDATGHKP